MNNISRYKGKTVLVTGGAGFIGSNLVQKLLKQKIARIVIIDNFSSSTVQNIPSDPRIKLIRGTIINEKILSKAFDYEVDLVFHLAAQFANQNSVDHPVKDLHVNGLGTLMMLDRLKEMSVERFVYTSSSGVYGDAKGHPLDEQTSDLHLETPYQITKLLGEYYCDYFNMQYNVPTVNLRLFNVYGPGDLAGRYRNVIPNFLFWALTGNNITITGTGEETRDFTYIDDVIDGMLLAGFAEKAISESINIASGTETNIITLAKMINELTGNNKPISYQSRRDWDNVTRKRASIKKAINLLRYKPKTPLRSGIIKTITWFKKNFEKIRTFAAL